MTQPQDFYKPVDTADLRVDEREYFGAPLRDIEPHSRDQYGLRSLPSTSLHRVSYVFQMVYHNGDNYGGIQARARTFLHLDDDGAVPVGVQRQVQRSAHRAAHIFDSDLEEPIYGYNGGYLSGFDQGHGAAWENQDQDGASDPDDLRYQNWEVEKVAGIDQGAAGVGGIDWSLEIYLEEQDDSGFTGFAALSGLAVGTTNPWSVTTEHVEGRQPVHVPPTKWQIGWEDSRRDGKGEYYVRPQPDSEASKRYGDTKEHGEGAGRGKTVYINGKPISDGTDGKARAWLSPEYGVGDGLTYRGKYSREGLVQNDEQEATYSALSRNGVLYQTGETEDGVYLVTAREKPDDWQAADPDSVPVKMEVQEGISGTTRHLLTMDDPEHDPLEVSVSKDEKIIEHLGYSTPPYSHHVEADGWEWPGFRPVEEYANTGEYHPDPRQYGDDDAPDRSGQTHLDGYDDEGSR